MALPQRTQDPGERGSTLPVRSTVAQSTHLGTFRRPRNAMRLIAPIGGWTYITPSNAGEVMQSLPDGWFVPAGARRARGYRGGRAVPGPPRGGRRGGAGGPRRLGRWGPRRRRTTDRQGGWGLGPVHRGPRGGTGPG